MHKKTDEVSRRQFMIDNAYRLLGVSVLPMLGSTIASEAQTFGAPSSPELTCKRPTSAVLTSGEPIRARRVSAARRTTQRLDGRQASMLPLPAPTSSTLLATSDTPRTPDRGADDRHARTLTPPPLPASSQPSASSRRSCSAARRSLASASSCLLPRSTRPPA